MRAPGRRTSQLPVLLALASFLVTGAVLGAQGCEPIRFTTPVNLGGQGKAYQPGHEWQLTLAYRHLNADDWFVGSVNSPSRAPGGLPGIFEINTFVADVSYSATDRIRLGVSVPLQSASFSHIFPDRAIHAQTAKGIGDISVMAESWLLDPRTNESGNVSIGLGLKAPTGSHSQASTFYTATGPVSFPADQTIQNGDGGWAVLTQAQAFRSLTQHVIAYASGSYMISPKAQSDVVVGPGSTVPWAVPDVYSAHVGAAYSVLANQRLTLSLGARLDGTPVHDLVGGGDDVTNKRPFYLLYTEPGLSVTNGHGTFTLSTPIRTSVHRELSVFDRKTNNTVAGGGFAKFLVFASYSYRL